MRGHTEMVDNSKYLHMMTQYREIGKKSAGS